ncbi:MAG: thiol reductant ABC exporter subunit CydC [Clostridiales Family XIII bacterium]|jgi:ATP-binding cassette subfamily C protein|nr:thiol reductant ABC exporter subunit CydC [Clostridiales Family XIII bacterium]
MSGAAGRATTGAGKAPPRAGKPAPTTGRLRIVARLVSLVARMIPEILLAVVVGAAGHLSAIAIPVLGVLGVLGVTAADAGAGAGAGAPAAGAQTIPTLLFVLLGICAAARAALRYAEQYLNHHMAFKLLALLREKVFRAMRRLSPARMEGRDKGDLISVMTADIELIEVFYAHTITPVLIAAVVCTATVLVIARFSPAAAPVAALAYLLVGVVLPLVASGRTGRLGERFREDSGGLSAFLLGSLRGLHEIIRFGAGARRLADIEAKTDALTGVERRMRAHEGLTAALAGLVILGFSALVPLATYLSVRGGSGADAYSLIVPTVVTMSSFGPVAALSALGSGLANTFAAAERVLGILDEPPATPEQEDGVDIGFAGAEFEDVSFAYEGGERVLDGLNLSVQPGRILGVSGRSGSGKSTLLRLLMRFWDADSGEVRVSGVGIRDVNTASLRGMEGFVTQDTVIFKGTIRENITIGAPDATDEEIRAACEKAAVHDFIMGLPGGYEAQTEELGGNLSGGERQRIGLARAFLHGAPLILLDEPTSNLDSLNEAVILKALKDESQGRTVVLVSHRASTMGVCDAVYKMEEL